MSKYGKDFQEHQQRCIQCSAGDQYCGDGVTLINAFLKSLPHTHEVVIGGPVMRSPMLGGLPKEESQKVQLSESEKTIRHLTFEVNQLKLENERLKNPNGASGLTYNIQLRDLFACTFAPHLFKDAMDRVDRQRQIGDTPPLMTASDIWHRAYEFADTGLNTRRERYGAPAEE